MEMDGIVLCQFHTEGSMLSAAGLVVHELTECSPGFSVNWWSRVKASLFPWANTWGIETGSIQVLRFKSCVP